MAERKIEVLNPIGGTEVKERKLAPRPRGLHGLRLGVLDNSKHNSDHFLMRAAQRLGENFGLKENIVRKKVGPSVPVPQEDLSALSGCDLLLTAFGD